MYESQQVLIVNDIIRTRLREAANQRLASVARPETAKRSLLQLFVDTLAFVRRTIAAAPTESRSALLPR